MQRAHAMPFGAQLTPGGVRFALWAPTAKQVTLVVDGQEIDLPDPGDGWREVTVPDAKAGSLYQYRIGKDLMVPDPASRFQPDDAHGPSMVVDPNAYGWSVPGWHGRPWEKAVIYEVHVGTATPEGTYKSLERRLPELVDLGITAIELMPIGDFPGKRNWGYDGVLIYAPDAAYGTPDELKHFVDAAHRHGLMVLLDVVYNHFGPSGNYLHAFAKTFFTERHHTPWGAAINVDGEGAAVVRDFFVHNALYWLEEYNLDGLRLDAVHAILDDSERHLLDELARRVRAAFPGREIHLILENEANEARWLERAGGKPHFHTAQWADDIHNCWHPLLTGEDEGYYEDFADSPVEKLGRALAEGFCYQGEQSRHLGKKRGEPSGHLPPQAFIAFLQNHDQVGNRALGERLAHIVPAEKLKLARAALLLGPQIPMLFMGEDWDASAPFQFFVDFSDDKGLSKAVREGRRAEFKKFKAFEGHKDRVPDPTDPKTFERSRIDWDEVHRKPHATSRAETKDLLRIRAEEIVPLLKTPFRGGSYELPHDLALVVEWLFDGGRLRLLANFGDDVLEAELVPGERLLWRSTDSVVAGTSVHLPRWTGAIIKGGA